MNLRDLRYLVAVADHGHFGRAAEACFVSQPTLSTQIRKLERELGVDLIERNPRHLVLTEAGRQIVDKARSVVSEADDIVRIADRARDPEGGTIRLGLFPTLAPYLLPHVVPLVHKRFPKMELLLVEEKSDEILARLRDGRIDAGLLALPIPDKQLHFEPLFVEDFLLAVPSDHPLARSTDPVPTSVLAAEPVLLLEEGHCLRDQALSVCRLAGAQERPGFRATSLETLRQMVASGVGLTLLPALAVQPPVTVSEDVTLLALAEPMPRREIAMVWRPSSPSGPLLSALAQTIRDLPESVTGVRRLDPISLSPTPVTVGVDRRSDHG